MPTTTYDTPGSYVFSLSGKTNVTFVAWSAGGRGARADFQDCGGGGGGAYAEGAIPPEILGGDLNVDIGDGSDPGGTATNIVSTIEGSLSLSNGGDGGDTTGGAGGTLVEDLGSWVTSNYDGGQGGNHASGAGNSSGSGGGAAASSAGAGASGSPGSIVGGAPGDGGEGEAGAGSGGQGGDLEGAGSTGLSPGGGGGGAGDQYANTEEWASGGHGKVIFTWTAVGGGAGMATHQAMLLGLI